VTFLSIKLPKEYKSIIKEVDFLTSNKYCKMMNNTFMLSKQIEEKVIEKERIQNKMKNKTKVDHKKNKDKIKNKKKNQNKDPNQRVANTKKLDLLYPVSELKIWKDISQGLILSLGKF
jgi:hypothetical protein